MFAYCNNNPLNLSDHSGSEPITIGLGIIACAFIIGAGVSALTTWATGGSGKEILLSGAAGGIGAALTIVFPAISTKVAVCFGVNTCLQMLCDDVKTEYAILGGVLTTASAFIIPSTGDIALDNIVNATFGVGLDLTVGGTQEAIARNCKNAPYQEMAPVFYNSPVGGSPRNVTSLLR